MLSLLLFLLAGVSFADDGRGLQFPPGPQADTYTLDEEIQCDAPHMVIIPADMG
jgi:hypothetical protein